jgi:hypothetical protein
MTQDKPPTTTKLTPAEQRQRREDRLITIRLRIAIGRELEDQGITTPAAIGEALGMPADEATKLMTRRQWREGDVERLQAAAARLGLHVPGEPVAQSQIETNIYNIWRPSFASGYYMLRNFIAVRD